MENLTGYEFGMGMSDNNIKNQALLLKTNISEKFAKKY